MKLENWLLNGVKIEIGKLTFCSVIVKIEIGKLTFCSVKIEIGKLTFCSVKIEIGKLTFCSVKIEIGKLTFCSEGYYPSDIHYKYSHHPIVHHSPFIIHNE